MSYVRSILALVVLTRAAAAQPEPAPPPVPPPDPPSIRVTYDKGVRFQTADGTFELRLELRTQQRLEIERTLAEGAEFESHFVLPRNRLHIEGHAFGPENRYKLELGMSERGSFSFVKDYFVEREVGGVWFRVGQWKRPFNRQEIIADFAATFNERSIVNELAGGGRDLGAAIHNDYDKSPEGLEWVIGVFNTFSGGADRPQITTTCTEDPVDGEITCTNSPATNFPADFDPAVVVRVGWNHGLVKGYQEVDLDGGPLRFGIAVNYKIDLANGVVDDVAHGLGVDAIAKVAGFDAQIAGIAMKTPGSSPLLGGLVQAGYVVVPKRVQVAGRAAVRQLADTDRKQIEVRAAFNYFFAGHALKIASDIGFLKLTGGGDPELQVRIMPQLTF